MTKKEQALDESSSLFDSLDLDSPVEESEACKVLQQRWKLTRQEIADLLGLTLRQVMTRLVEFKGYSAKGLIPTGNLPAVYTQGMGRGDVLADEAERLKRGLVNTETRQVLEAATFEDRFAKAVAIHIPSKHDLRHLDDLYRELKSKRLQIKGDEEAAVPIITDAHLGLENDQYNKQIARGVIDKFITKTIRLTELHRTQCPVKKCYLVLAGDNVQGSSGNFSAQRWTVHETAVDQCEFMVGTFVEVIERLLIEYDEVIVVCMPGNHGALYPKKVSVEPEHSNIEHVAHRTLQWAFRGNKRVSFRLTNEWYQVTALLGVRALIHHGHLIGSGSLDRFRNNVRKLDGILPGYDIGIFGHLHQPTMFTLPMPHGGTTPRYGFINGTSVLGDRHSEQFGVSHGNAWWNLFVNSRRVTAQYPVGLYA